MILFFPPP